MKTNQTIAQQLMGKHKNGAELSNACAELSVEQEHNWECETTAHTFADGSQLVDCCGQVYLVPYHMTKKAKC